VFDGFDDSGACVAVLEASAPVVREGLEGDAGLVAHGFEGLEQAELAAHLAVFGEFGETHEICDGVVAAVGVVLAERSIAKPRDIRPPHLPKLLGIMLKHQTDQIPKTPPIQPIPKERRHHEINPHPNHILLFGHCLGKVEPLLGAAIPAAVREDVGVVGLELLAVDLDDELGGHEAGDDEDRGAVGLFELLELLGGGKQGIGVRGAEAEAAQGLQEGFVVVVVQGQGVGGRVFVEFGVKVYEVFVGGLVVLPADVVDGF
jgi:hypothetical protein